MFQREGKEAKQGVTLTTQDSTARAARLPACMLAKFLNSCGVRRIVKVKVEAATMRSVMAGQSSIFAVMLAWVLPEFLFLSFLPCGRHPLPGQDCWVWNRALTLNRSSCAWKGS